jgi:pimeloyl-ACP methyl ester carboxylesterase
MKRWATRAVDSALGVHLCLTLASPACTRPVADQLTTTVQTPDVSLQLFSAAATAGNWGTGALTIIGVHGGPAIVTTSMTQLASLAGVGFDVVWFHQRGVPPSSPSASGDYGLPAYAADIVHVTQAVGRSAPRVLIAFSWGALPAIAAVQSDPTAFDGLVLVSPAPPTWRANTEIRSAIEDALDRWTMLGELPPDWRERPSCEQLVISSAGLDADRPTPPRGLRAAACNVEVMQATRRAVGRYDLVESFRSLDLPVLVVRGEYDVLGRVATFEDQPPPQTTARTLAGCGHGILADAECRAELFAEFRRWAAHLGPRQATVAPHP